VPSDRRSLLPDQDLIQGYFSKRKCFAWPLGSIRASMYADLSRMGIGQLQPAHATYKSSMYKKLLLWRKSRAMRLGFRGCHVNAESYYLIMFAAVIASRTGSSRVQIGNYIRPIGLWSQAGMRRGFSRSVVRTNNKPVYYASPPSQDKYPGSHRRSRRKDSNSQVLCKIKLEAAFAYEMFGHTLVPPSAQLTLIDVFVLCSRAVGWLAPRIIILKCS
jgi:hypothetical protein